MLDGRTVRVYTLTNSRGAKARITNFGGLLLSLEVPDRRGRLGDVVLGFDTVAQYPKDSPYFGALIGRYGNRIARGRFTLDGKTYSLPINNKPNSLHGGTIGFDKKIWNSRPLNMASGPGLELRLFSPAGDQGYPGNLNTRVTYQLTNSNELKIEYYGTADKATPFNPTHHSYFNLKGAGNGDILGHILKLNASRMTPVDSTLIPTGVLQSVKGTPFDFTRPHRIGERIDTPNNDQLKYGAGYDHNFVVNGTRGVLRMAAHVEEPTSGRVMDVYTTEKGIQLYTGNYISKLNGKDGKTYARRYGFCLETQDYPDAPNQKNFPNSILRPGKTYRQTTIYRFSAK
ncbi:galactose mutarotase [bacterium]|nr:MAG: galactose mutarotase [bacterium]